MLAIAKEHNEALKDERYKKQSSELCSRAKRLVDAITSAIKSAPEDLCMEAAKYSSYGFAMMLDCCMYFGNESGHETYIADVDEDAVYSFVDYVKEAFGYVVSLIGYEFNPQGLVIEFDYEDSDSTHVLPSYQNAFFEAGIRFSFC